MKRVITVDSDVNKHNVKIEGDEIEIISAQIALSNFLWELAENSNLTKANVIDKFYMMPMILGYLMHKSGTNSINKLTMNYVDSIAVSARYGIVKELNKALRLLENEMEGKCND